MVTNCPVTQVPGAEAVPEGYTWKNVLASYVHLHFGSAPQLASSLVARCHAVDLHAVNAAATRACHQAELAAAHAEQQQAFQHSSHMPGQMAPHGNAMHNGAFNPQAHLPKMMSTPDFAMPFQSSLQRAASQMGRHSADDAQDPLLQLQQQQQQQILQQAHQQLPPRKSRYDADGHVDVYAQAYTPADYQGLSPQRTSSLPIFHKPLKPYSIPTSPLHEVAEHSSMDGQHSSYQPQWASQPGLHPQQHPPLVYPQQPHQQRSPFHSPPQGHGSQSPTYPPPLESAHSGVLPMNAILQSNRPDAAMLSGHSGMLSGHSGMLSANSGMMSVNSGMLPDGVVYRPNSIGSAHPGMLSAQSSMLPSGASMGFERANSLLHADAVSSHRHDDTCTASSSGRLAHELHGPAWSRSSSTGLQSASPDTAVSSHSIVSLLPSGTEILYALGLADR